MQKFLELAHYYWEVCKVYYKDSQIFAQVGYKRSVVDIGIKAEKSIWRTGGNIHTGESVLVEYKEWEIRDNLVLEEEKVYISVICQVHLFREYISMMILPSQHLLYKAHLP